MAQQLVQEMVRQRSCQRSSTRKKRQKNKSRWSKRRKENRSTTGDASTMILSRRAEQEEVMMMMMSSQALQRGVKMARFLVLIAGECSSQTLLNVIFQFVPTLRADQSHRHPQLHQIGAQRLGQKHEEGVIHRDRLHNLSRRRHGHQAIGESPRAAQSRQREPTKTTGPAVSRCLLWALPCAAAAPCRAAQ